VVDVRGEEITLLVWRRSDIGPVAKKMLEVRPMRARTVRISLVQHFLPRRLVLLPLATPNEGLKLLKDLVQLGKCFPNDTRVLGRVLEVDLPLGVFLVGYVEGFGDHGRITTALQQTEIRELFSPCPFSVVV
jgi:hypothetical protein